MLAPSEGELFVGHELKLYFSYEFVYNLGFCLLMCLGIDGFEFILVGTCWASWKLIFMPFIKCREFPAMIFKYSVCSPLYPGQGTAPLLGDGVVRSAHCALACWLPFYFNSLSTKPVYLIGVRIFGFIHESIYKSLPIFSEDLNQFTMSIVFK